MENLRESIDTIEIIPYDLTILYIMVINIITLMYFKKLIMRYKFETAS